jgi:hypothetical protein
MSDTAISIVLVVTGKSLIQRLPNVCTASNQLETQNFQIGVNDVRETLVIVSRIAADYELRLCIGLDSASGTDADGARDLSFALEHELYKVVSKS